MPDLARNLDRAGEALRRSVARVRGGRDATMIPLDTHLEQGTLRPRGRDSALDQSIAALQAVVWIASFVQGVFNEIRGRPDEL